MSQSAHPQPSIQTVYRLRTQSQVSGTHLVKGFIAYIGLNIADPYLMTVGGTTALGGASLVIADDQALCRVLGHPDVGLSSEAVVELRDPDEPIPERVKRMALQAKRGHAVVRVVRGDTLAEAGVAEEAAECVEAGCEVYLMPGVSRMSAVMTMAGVVGQPRGMYFSDVGERRPTADDVPKSDWAIVTCPVRSLSDLSAAARKAGRADDEPVLVIVGGGTQDQHSRRTTVAGLADVRWARKQDAAREVMVGFGAAGVTRPQLEGTQSRPLFGWRVLLPRTRESSGAVERRLALLGASVQPIDTLAVEPPHRSQPMDRAIQQLVDGNYRWVVFASSLGVRLVFDKVREYGLDARAFSGMRIAALSPMTVRVLDSWGLVPDLKMPQVGHTAANFVASFPEYDASADPMDAVFVPRTDPAADWIGEGLRGLGWDVDEVAACRVVRAAPPPEALRGDIKSGRFDAVVFTSSSSVRSLLGLAGKPGPQSIICAIGPATAATCQQYGLKPQVVASRPGSGELVEALARFAGRWRAQHQGNDLAIMRPSQMRGARAAGMR